MGKEVFEEIIENGIEYELHEMDGYAKVIGFTKKIPEHVIIPSEIKGLPVTHIDDGAFTFCDTITSLIISDGIKKIGDSAFLKCFLLKNIVIPNSVDFIGCRVFDDCLLLSEIKVDSENSVYCDIDGVLFDKNKIILIRYPIGKKQTSYKIPNSVKIIDEGAFCNCRLLKNITIPNSVTKITALVFAKCSSLTSLKIPDTVSFIGSLAFWGCTNLKSLYLPKLKNKFSAKLFCAMDDVPEIFFKGTKGDFEFMFAYDIFEEHIAKNEDGYFIPVIVHCIDGDLIC